eukprot:3591329-Ditylum_brightwellii.AAC.1
MSWLLPFLLNFMTPELQQTAISTLHSNYKKHEHEGMLTYTVMIDKIINLSKQAIKSMTKNIKEYNISNMT